MNSEKVLPIVVEKLGGVERKLQLSMRGIIQYERLTGINLIYGQGDFSKLYNQVVFIWACLLVHHPEFDGDFLINGEPSQDLRKKLKEVENWITIENAVDLLATIGKLVVMSSQDAVEEKPESKNAETQDEEQSSSE